MLELDTWKMDLESDECKLSRDLVIYIMEHYYIGYDWQPSSDLTQKAETSPFTLQVQNVVEQIFNELRLKMHALFEEKYTDQTNKRVKKFKKISTFFIKSEFILENNFLAKEFLVFCVKLVIFAARCFYYGEKIAPRQAIGSICSVLQKLKERGYFTVSSWERLQIDCKNEDFALVRW